MPATPDRGPAAPSPQTALGFDFGLARIGVAVGEAITGSARPLCVLKGRDRGLDWDAIGRLIDEWRPGALVVGAARHADGSANAVTGAALRFARQLRGRFKLPVATIDERLSSWEAERRLENARGRPRRRDPGADAGAAAVILESWFNQQRNPPSCATPNS
ncbi:MAG: Holliday junction resolvase RuvX [Candidatus Competibacteraceae bacterium]|nr:Holliday junction resolvase RuvX [Candidatus Competibacteraceae bacterium]